MMVFCAGAAVIGATDAGYAAAATEGPWEAETVVVAVRTAAAVAEASAEAGAGAPRAGAVTPAGAAVTSATSATSATSVTAITVRTTVSLEELPGGAQPLLGLASTPDGGLDLLAVAWSEVRSGWLPTWQLSLTGRLLEEAGLRTPISVPQVTPAAERRYELAVSYDGATGLLSVSVHDVTQAAVIAGQGWQVAPYGGPVYPVAGTGITLESAPGYRPLDLQWDAGARLGNAFVARTSLEPDEANAVRVRAQGPLPGELRLVLGNDGTGPVVATGRLTERQAYLEIPPGTLSAGHTTLTLLYVGEDGTEYALSRSVRAGRIDGAVRLGFDRENGLFDGTLQLYSASRLSGVALTVRTDVYRMQWDTARRAYDYVAYSTYTAEFEGLEIGTDGASVPLRIPAPEEAAAWRVDVKVTATPDVVVQIDPAVAYVSTHAPAQIAPGEAFTLAIFPDTQYYAESYGQIYMRMTEWLSANAAALRVPFALHVGDITDDNTPVQWRVARDAHSLLDGVVPYVVVPGNHDYAAGGQVADRSTTLLNEYFRTADFPNLAGTMEPGRIENAYYEFVVGDAAYLVVALEFAPSDAALAWANEVVAAHPEHRVIVVTHTFLHPSTQPLASGSSAATFPLGRNPNTTLNDGEDIWNKFVRRHPNIIFVVNGHIHSDALPYRITFGDHGNRVLQMLANFQAGPQGGEGYLVLLEIQPDGTVAARAYSPYLGQEKRAFDRYGNVVPLTLRSVFAPEPK